MSEISKETLSKRKFIYRLYDDRVGLPHIEKYPVIYINEEYVYFKVAGKQELAWRRLRDTRKGLSDYINYDENKHFGHWKESFFWEDDIDLERLYLDINEQRKMLQKKLRAKELIQKELTVQRLEKDYKKALNELELLKSKHMED